ncbi:uncharacterized protein LOC131892806 [Tigriopus californicus]|uniref:uncharacterized protein LOC131892806 n=1 Tax=Tigriopus californicus TaxID=6832 RepID=UPI0027DA833C|nr:uncharacterized protein LOC131892806 [Tigriopus californicus]
MKLLTVFVCVIFVLTCPQDAREIPQEVLVLLSGTSPSTVAVVNSIGFECDVEIPEIPQPYGSPGRRGMSAGYWNRSLIACGGLDNSGPPISSFKDCQMLDLDTRMWQEGPDMPELLAYSGYTMVGSVFYVIGGYHTKYDGGGPTQYVYSDQIYFLDLADIEIGWVTLDMKLPSASSDLCAVASPKGNIFVIGSLSGYFNPNQADSWTSIPNQEGVGLGCDLYLTEFNSSIVVAVGGSSLKNKVETLNIGSEDLPDMAWNTDLPPFSEERTRRPSIGVLNLDLIIAGGSQTSSKIEKFTEFGWSQDASGALKETRADQASIRVPSSMFPECQS